VFNAPTVATDPSGLILFGFIPTNGDEWSAFGGSLSDSYNSITDGLAGTYMIVAPTWAGGNTQAGQQLLNEAYDKGPFGQTANGPAWSYYGTRGAIGVATTATVLAVGACAWSAAGFPRWSNNVDAWYRRRLWGSFYRRCFLRVCWGVYFHD